MAPQDEIENLRAERDEWRRRAEVAEAVAAERLARAETAERALRATEGLPFPPPHPVVDAGVDLPGPATAQATAPAEPKRPASLRERWRRYTDTIS